VPEYSLPFAQKLAKAATLVAAEGLNDPDAKRAVLYISLLSTEISLKAMLEKAGVPLPKIRKRSHDLAGLLRDVSQCKVEVQVTPSTKRYLPALRLRNVTLTYPPAQPTVGEIIDAEIKGASKYPGAVRYGKLPSHYPPELVAQMATKVAAFAKSHWSSIRTA
jgi:hypothetical protein